MSQPTQFTIEQLCKYMTEGKLMAARCAKCGKVHFPPRPLCDKCLSKNFEWIEITPKGKLLTYTIIHVAPAQFQTAAPYAVGIVQFEHGVKVPGMIRDLKQNQLEIGMPLTISFDACAQTDKWPQWPRYHFNKI